MCLGLNQFLALVSKVVPIHLWTVICGQLDSYLWTVIYGQLFFGLHFYGSHTFHGQSLLFSTTVLNDDAYSYVQCHAFQLLCM